MKKNLALAIALTLTLGATTPAFAFTFDGRDRDFNPIQKILKLFKKLVPTSLEDMLPPHP